MNEVTEIESIPTKIKYKGIIWIPESKTNNINNVNNVNKIDKVDKNFNIPTEKPIRLGNLKKPYIVKWIERFDVGAVFTLDQFYYKYPKLKKHSVGHMRVDKIISDMITDRRIVQLGNDKFKVLK